MGNDARKSRLKELREEMLQLNSEKSMGGTASNMGAYRATRRSIARLLTKMYQDRKE
jgi:ribosomal protein L29